MPRIVLAIAFAFIIAILFAFRTDPTPIPGFAVVELFTSEGCSSCPPADLVLRELNERAEKNNEAIYALSFHVDYWNYLGWADPFSDAKFSARQSDYSDRLSSRTYTPQMVINGSTEMVGSRRDEVLAAVKKSLARTPTATLSATSQLKGGQIKVDFTIAGNLSETDRLVALLVQPEATTEVRRGENRGRELTHVRVVRQMNAVNAERSGQVSLDLSDNISGKPEVILLLQSGRGGAITAATSLQPG